MVAAKLLRQARRRAGLSQRRLAERAGVHQPDIARIESGKVDPRVGTLFRLLKACDERLESVPVPESGVDRSQIRERLGWSVEQRLEELVESVRDLSEIQVTAR